MSSDCDAFFDENDRPANYESVLANMARFCEQHKSAGNKVVLVTSGGTTVPFERNVVR